MSFLDTFCSLKETRNINAKLKDLYGVWHRGLKIYDANDSQLNGKSLNPLHLLTCTDSYLKKRVMIFGQEAHDTNNAWTINKSPEDYYLTEFPYDLAIHNCDRQKAPRTLFLKQRILLAGMDKKCANRPFTEDEKQDFHSVLINNLNKTSYAGDHLGVIDHGLLARIYDPFEYEGTLGTIFEHELIILRPRKIVFLTGKGYWSHMKRDFKTIFAYGCLEELMREKVTNLNMSCKPVSDPIEFRYRPGSQGEDCRAVVCYHPNARMRIDVRETLYDKAMLDFVKS